jgi:excinuclease UvrABC ATPase subunit
MRLSEILQENKQEHCPECSGTGMNMFGSDFDMTSCEECDGTGFKKEELEEIKVTKTLAKKRTTPMKDMATKEKMTRKKKGKDGKIKKDAKKPMNRNVHDLANITLKGEYRS